MRMFWFQFVIMNTDIRILLEYKQDKMKIPLR